MEDHHPEIQHFTHLPWCTALLSSPSFRLHATGSRFPKRSGEDSFIAETLRTPRTIPAWLTLTSVPNPTASPPIQEIRALIALGSGLNGHPRLAHGGAVATLLDELAGILLTVNVDEENRARHSERGLDAFTAYLNVGYRKPLPLPGVVLGTARIERVVGRKSFVVATLEDGEGLVYARAEALFVGSARAKL